MRDGWHNAAEAGGKGGQIGLLLSRVTTGADRRLAFRRFALPKENSRRGKLVVVSAASDEGEARGGRGGRRTFTGLGVIAL